MKNMTKGSRIHLALLAALIIALQCFHTSLASEEEKAVYIVYMGEKRHPDPDVVSASHYDLLASILGRENAIASIVYSYKHGFSGFAAWLTESQAQQLAELEEIISVKRNQIYHAHTTRSWDFIGLDYNNPTGLTKKTNYGDGIIIGVIDSGIWPESASFSDEGYGPVPSRWNGTCQVGQNFTTSNCNRKIIGARYYKDPGLDDSFYKNEYMSARDAEGHGTHTSSTAGGNIVNNVSFFGLASGTAHGGAPRARLAIYKVLWGGSTSEAPLLKAIDDAIGDGVDVLSISIGGPFLEVSGTLHAVVKGIVVVFAGGNDGPAPRTVGNAEPWVITVAASTIDRSFPTTITLGDNTKIQGQSRLYGAELDFTSIIAPSSCDEASLSSINITGMIVLCYAPDQVANTVPKNDIGTVFKSVKNANASGLIYAQYTTNLLDDLQYNLIMPTVVVDFITADVILQYCESNNIRTAKLSLSHTMVGKKVPAPRVAAFSSRGPSRLYPGVLKPDIAAPGVNILAAAAQVGDPKAAGVMYQFMSGTSMACPHVSGIVALLKSLHPDWSPAAIKSALVTTASVVDGYGLPILAESTPRKIADPFDYGGGQVNPEKAADPGLVYDINPYEYLNFYYCSNGLDECSAKTTDFYGLNLPSVSIHDLKTTITISRTVTNVGPVKSVYKASFQAPPGVNVTVNPDTLEFNEGAKTHTFNITFTAIHSIQGDFTFGSLTWSDGDKHSVRIPIAIRIIIEDLYADVS